MIWGIVSLLFAFFLGPLAKKTAHRLGLAAVYVVSCFFFLNALLDMDSPLYTHFVPQTLALFDLTFVADILSLIFCVIITLVGAIVMFYSARYVEEDEATRFSTLINFFTLSMLGLVLSHNLMGIFIFWEFTALCSYFLISFDGSNEEARRAAWQALLINAFGGLAMLCGLLILGGIGGSYDLLQIRMPESHPWMGTAMILILVGVLTKSAQFPFHFWLPNAMTAPSPASAYLHSATMVNAGIFLLFRLSPFLSVHEYWGKILIPAGITTALLASALLLFEKDLKRILAYTTLVSLGLMTYLIGKNDAAGYYLAILLFVTHALYKAPLFLLAGSIENYSGSRDVTLLSQLYPRMKGSLVVAILGAFSLLGLPPVLSFHTKEEFFSLIGKSPTEFAILIFVFAVSGSVAITLVSLFIKGNREESKIEDRFFDNENDPSLLWVPPALGLALCFMLGARFSVLSQYIKDNLGQVLAYDFESIGQDVVSHKLTLLASGAVIFFSIFFAVAAAGLRKINLSRLEALSFDKNWDLGFKSLMTLANKLFSFFQNNRLELYAAFYFIFLFFMISQISGLELSLPLLSLKFSQATPFEIILIAAMIIASTMAIKVESNLSAIAVLGIIGFGIGYLYLVNSAPDLALTQFLVESLTLIILVITFKKLPKNSYQIDNKWLKISCVSISIALGLSSGVLTFLASSSLRPQTLSRYFGEKSLNIAHGHNVVNVTIVDFRGLDTLGEITVLILAGIGVASLLKRNKARKATA